MKKRALLVVSCAVLLLLVLVGCRSGADLPENADTTEPGDTTGATPQKTYQDIPRVTHEAHKSLYLSFGDGMRVFDFTIPSEWKLSEEQGGYAIKRAGNTVGSIRSGEGETETLGAALHEETTSSGNESMHYAIYEEDAGKFVHRFVFRYAEKSGKKRVFTMQVDLEEMDEHLVRRTLYAYRSAEPINDVAMGMLSLPPQPSILIIGNSFVNSSHIGDMMDSFGGTDCRSVSIGYLTVRRLCSEYSEFLDEMREGAYDAVFLCGFYAVADATEMEAVVEACRESGTELIVFPAHNENASAIEAAKINPYVKVLNWKGEIDLVCSELDVPLDALRIDDTHGHSTSLAGYIGAHMIYRAIFGEVPPIRDQYGTLSHSYVEEFLGEYMTRPEIGMVPSEEITYLS